MTAGILLAGSGVLSFAATQTVTPHPATSATVRKLQVENQAKDDQLLKLRQLFVYCNSSVVHRTDDRCLTPGASSQGSSLAVSQPVRALRDSDDNDDNGDPDTTIIVQQPRPAASPSRGSERPHPNPTSNQPPERPDQPNRGRRHQTSGGHSGTGHGPTGHDR